MDVPQVAEKHYEKHLDRWLLARSQGEDASEMPHARELRRAVRDLEEYRPKAHDALERVYLSKDADPALPARWLRDIEKDRSPDRWKTEKQRWNLHHLADARRYILHALYFEAERRRERGTVYYYQGGRPVCPVCWQELPSGEAPVRYPWPLVGDLGEIPVPPEDSVLNSVRHFQCAASYFSTPPCNAQDVRTARKDVSSATPSAGSGLDTAQLVTVNFRERSF